MIIHSVYSPVYHCIPYVHHYYQVQQNDDETKYDLHCKFYKRILNYVQQNNNIRAVRGVSQFANP